MVGTRSSQQHMRGGGMNANDVETVHCAHQGSSKLIQLRANMDIPMKLNTLVDCLTMLSPDTSGASRINRGMTFSKDHVSTITRLISTSLTLAVTCNSLL